MSSDPRRLLTLDSVLRYQSDPFHSAVLYVIAHSSQDFSVIFTNTKKNLDSIFKSARKFAPQYSIRHIQQTGEPTPQRSLSPNPKISEIADVQWFIKAYFYQICDDRIEESMAIFTNSDAGIADSFSKSPEAMKTNSADDLTPKHSRKSTTTSGNEIRQEQQGVRRTSEFLHHPARSLCRTRLLFLWVISLTDPLPFEERYNHPETPATGHICSSSGDTKVPELILPRPLLRPGCAQSALVAAIKKRPYSPPPPLFTFTSIPVATSSVRNPSIHKQGNVSRRTPRILRVSNECIEWVLEALEPAIPCLLELLENDSSKPDGPSKNLVLENESPGFAALALFDPKIQERLSYAVSLRRQIRDPMHSKLVAHEELIEATIKDALVRIRKGK